MNSTIDTLLAENNALKAELAQAKAHAARQSVLLRMQDTHREGVHAALTKAGIPSMKTKEFPEDSDGIGIIERVELAMAELQKYRADLLAAADRMWTKTKPDEVKYPKRTYKTMWWMYELEVAGMEVTTSEIDLAVRQEEMHIRQWEQVLKMRGAASGNPPTRLMGRLSRSWYWYVLACRASEYAGECYRNEQAEHAKTKTELLKVKKALGEIGSGSPSTFKDGLIDGPGPGTRTCTMCATHIDHAREALDWAPWPAIPGTVK